MSLIQADARRIPLVDGCVQCVVTSPPYWGLRDYGTARWEGGDPACDHSPEKRGGRFATPVSGKQASNTGSGTISRPECPCGAARIDAQIGLEASPGAYTAILVAVFREVWRVLADDGVLFLNLGDSYAGARAEGGGTMAGFNDRYFGRESDGGKQAVTDTGKPARAAVAGLKPKDLVGIPWRVAFALQADGWYLRSDIIWAKTNPMPESVTDRPTKAHEYVFLLTKQERYYYDADAIAEAQTSAGFGGFSNKATTKLARGVGANGQPLTSQVNAKNDGKRNIRSVWSIPTRATRGLVGTSRQVRVSWDESDGDTTRIASPDCPVHGGRAVLAAKALCGERAGGQQSDNGRSDIGHGPSPLLDFVPTGPQPGDCSAAETTDSPLRSRSQPATPHSNESHRTDHALATTSPCIASGETISSTGGTSIQPQSSGEGSRTPESSTQDRADLVAVASAETASRIAGMSACSCYYYRITAEKVDHFATMPEKLAGRCILAGSRPGDLVFDPFGGSGTTVRVARQFNRRGAMLDLNPAYLKLADARTSGVQQDIFEVAQ